MSDYDVDIGGLSERDQPAETGIADASRSDQGVLDGTSQSARSESPPGLSERGQAEKPGAGSQLPLPARAPRSESPRLDGGEIGAEPVARRDEPQQPARRKSKRASHVSPPSSRGRCTAHAPAGTRCKLCGEVHPQREGKAVKIHVPGDLEAKEDFK